MELEGNENYVPVDLPTDATSYVRSHMIDCDEEDDVRIHSASLRNDVDELTTLLQEEGYEHWINFRVRPFNSTPLRLAVTAGNIECVKMLLDKGAIFDLEDIKGQTPLFVATSTQNLPIMTLLLERGANKEGSILNRGTPLIVAVRDGFTEGVKLLLNYGANCEPFSIQATCVPAWPLQHAVVYSHFGCFLELLKHGARTNLDGPFTNLGPSIINRLSVARAILKYAEQKPEFVQLYAECGGNVSKFRFSDNKISQISPAASEILRIQASVRPLKSFCRQKMLKICKNKRKFSKLQIPETLKSYLKFDDYNRFAS